MKHFTWFVAIAVILSATVIMAGNDTAAAAAAATNDTEDNTDVDTGSDDDTDDDDDDYNKNYTPSAGNANDDNNYGDDDEEVNYRKQLPDNIDPITMKCKPNYICVTDGHDFFAETQRIKYGSQVTTASLVEIAALSLLALVISSGTFALICLWLSNNRKHRYTATNTMADV